MCDIVKRFELVYAKLQPMAGNNYYDGTFTINLNYKMICILVQKSVVAINHTYLFQTDLALS